MQHARIRLWHGILRQKPMALRSETEWTVADLSGELEFTITRKEGSLQKIIRCAVVALLLLLAWKSANALWRALFAVGTLWPIADWLQGHGTQLRVGAAEITARGNLGRLVRTSISIPSPSVRSFEHAAGEDEIPGLYAVRKWGGRTLLVPNLNELTCRKIADCIVDRLPEIGADHEPGSLLYSERHDPIALGLSDRSSAHPRRQ
jgi:hypothetical protein